MYLQPKSYLRELCNREVDENIAINVKLKGVNLSDRMKVLAKRNKGILPKYTSYGCYPIFYVDGHNNVLCADCANENGDFQPVVDCDANYEDPLLFCDHCSTRIESAYCEEEE